MEIDKTGLDVILKEDIGEKDITSEMLFDKETAKGIIFTKENCVLAGLMEAVDLFLLKALSVFPKSNDGNILKPGTQVLEVEGRAVDILSVERTALNMLSKMSGIATRTRLLTEMVKKINPDCSVSATRKTTPGFRYYEKKAVVIGGGNPHRFGLFDAVLIKDNHIAIAGGLDKVLERIKDKQVPVEIEVESLEDGEKCAKAGVEIVMLDNFKPEEAETAYQKLKNINPNIVVEVSGGITVGNIKQYAKHADIISLSSVTISAPAIDFSMEIMVQG
jgi:nicotinate-nucleotide pyrophosphorylase (carboxylating)